MERRRGTESGGSRGGRTSHCPRPVWSRRAACRPRSRRWARIVWSSPVCGGLRRTAETASVWGREPDAYDSGLDEAHLGEWEGRYSADIRAHDPAGYAAWRSGLVTPPGGESFAQLTRRVVESLTAATADCAAAGGDALVVVTHGGPVRALLAELVGLDPARAVHSHPAGLSLLDADPVSREVKLRLYNCSSAVLEPDPAD